MDNAGYHHHWKVKQLIRVLGIPVLYLSQQCPNIAPIEKCFARVKKGDLNPLRISIAKRNLGVVVEKMQRAMMTCEGGFAVRLFANTVTELFKAISLSEYPWDDAQ